MATFNGARMVALFLCMLFAVNVSFAQDDDWVTVIVYMDDPITDERLAPEVEDYIDKWNDPFTWETFERDFTPAREGQMRQVDRDNARRIQKAEEYLKDNLRDRMAEHGDGSSSWYPSWIPLAFAETTEDSLFKNILDLEGALFENGTRQTLRQFFEDYDGAEPNGEDNGDQDYWECDDNRPRCRKNLYDTFGLLLGDFDGGSRIISFTIQARSSEGGITVSEVTDRSFVAELNEEGTTITRTDQSEEKPSAEFRWESIRLLQPAAMDPDEYVIDTTPYWQPAAKPVSSTETSSWGRIKATFADD